MGNQIIIYLSLIFIVGVYSLKERIIGGQSIKIETFPYIVSIRESDKDNLICAGTIITNKHILSAAHCFYGKDKYFDVLRVYTGQTNLSEPHTSVFSIESFHLHPDFEGRVIGAKQYHCDVSVLTIRGIIQFNSRQKKIELPNADCPGNNEVTVYGWGKTSYPLGQYSDQLQKVTIKLLTQADCKRMYPYPLRDDQLCTLSVGKSPSTGDSGGPVTRSGKIIGIVSFSIPWIQGTPQIQSNVYKHLDFIRSIIN